MSPSKVRKNWAERIGETPQTPLTDGNFLERWKTLSPREKEYLTLRHSLGLTIQEVADRCFVSSHTVKTTIWIAHWKLGTHRMKSQGTTLVPFLFGKAVARAEQRKRDLLSSVQDLEAPSHAH